MAKLVPIESIINKIVFLRDEKIILDRDLAELYGTDTFYRILPLFIHQAARTPDKKPKKWLDQLIAGI